MCDETKLREWWFNRQALDGSLSGESASTVLERTGWARSVGGANPYLSLFARAAISRQGADEAAARLEILELPAARGCTYVVPAPDFAVALRVGEGFADSEMQTARKLGVKDAEIDRLCSAVLKSLSGSELGPEDIRDAVGGAVRNLGEEGKKKGLATTLPVALRRLQSLGEIRRVPTNGRFDQQRYRYARWQPGPLEGYRGGEEEALTELAERFFRWAGPATVAEFQQFSGAGVRAARGAVETVGLVPIAPGETRLMHSRDLESLENFQPSKRPCYALVGSIDGISHLRRNLDSLLAGEDRSREVPGGEGNRTAGGLTDLPGHAIFDRGRLMGLWEYDTETESIAWMSFGPPDKALKAAVRRTEEFVKTELGDARSFSLDSPKSRSPRIEAIRSMSGP